MTRRGKLNATSGTKELLHRFCLLNFSDGSMVQEQKDDENVESLVECRNRDKGIVSVKSLT